MDGANHQIHTLEAAKCVLNVAEQLVAADCLVCVHRLGRYAASYNIDAVERSLGIAPNMLTRRLKHLTESGLFERRLYSERPKRYEYVLTQKGRDVFPVVVALIGFANRHLAPEGASLLLAERGTGRPITPIVVDAATLQPVTAENATVIAGPRASNDLRERLAARQAATQARSY